MGQVGSVVFVCKVSSLANLKFNFKFATFWNISQQDPRIADKKIIKRIVTKSGIRYYVNGKRVTSESGRKRFIKQNPNVPKGILTDAEKKVLERSKKALETYKKGWKFKGVAKVPYSYVDILAKLAVIDPKTIKDKDLYNVFENGKRKFKNFEDISPDWLLFGHGEMLRSQKGQFVENIKSDSINRLNKIESTNKQLEGLISEFRNYLESVK